MSADIETRWFDTEIEEPLNGKSLRFPSLGQAWGSGKFAFAGENMFIYASECCYEGEMLSNDRAQAVRVVVANPDSGAIARTLFEQPSDHIVSLDFDASGQHMIFVTNSGKVYRWTQGDERPTLIEVEDAVDAEW